MGRTRSPDSIKAEKLFLDGMKLVDIAKKLKVPEGTVRRWKSTQKWGSNAPSGSKKKQSERSDKSDDGKANVRKSKGGAPPGNKNSVGHKSSSPKGNKHNFKHGGYSAVYWDVLDEEERAMIEDMNTDPEYALIGQIKLYTVREHRLMKLINKYREMSTSDGKEIQVSMQISNRSETKRVFDGTPEEQKEQEATYKKMIADKVRNGDRLPGRDVHLFNQTENKDALIARLEEQLTRCSSAKNKALAELANIQREKIKLDLETSGSDMVNDWIAGVMGGDDDE